MKLCLCGLVLTCSADCCSAGKTLHQLTYTDSPLLKDCCLYKLAFKPCLELFKWVVLIASPQVRSAAGGQITCPCLVGQPQPAGRLGSMCQAGSHLLCCMLPLHQQQASAVGACLQTPHGTNAGPPFV